MENRRPKIVALRSHADFRAARGNGEARFQSSWQGPADPLDEARLPHGWWILPFGIAGFIEVVVLALWLNGCL